MRPSGAALGEGGRSEPSHSATCRRRAEVPRLGFLPPRPQRLGRQARALRRLAEPASSRGRALGKRTRGRPDHKRGARASLIRTGRRAPAGRQQLRGAFSDVARRGVAGSRGAKALSGEERLEDSKAGTNSRTVEEDTAEGKVLLSRSHCTGRRGWPAGVSASARAGAGPGAGPRSSQPLSVSRPPNVPGMTAGWGGEPARPRARKPEVAGMPRGPEDW